MTINYLDSKRLQGLSTDVTDTPTFEDDFSSYADQASADAVWATTDTTEMRVNPTTDVLDVQFSDDATNNSISYDIGSANISGTAWVLRFKLRFSSLTVADQSYFLIGLCDLNHTITNSSTSDFIGIFGENSSGSKYFACKSIDGTNMLTACYDPKSLTWATSTNYYFEIIRESATSMRINYYSDDAYSVLVNTSTTTTNMSTGLTGLRYFKCLNDSRAAMNGDWTGTIDDIKFYNGVTSLTSKPTNVQTNSIFEQTDTNTRHWYNGTNWNTGGHDKAISTYSPTFFLKLNEGTGTALTNSGTNSGYTASITNTDNYLSWVTGKTKQNALQMKPHPNNRINHTALPTNLASGYNFTMMLTVKFSAMNTDHFNIWTWANAAVGMYPILIKDKKLTSGYHNGSWYYIQDPNTFDNDVWYTFGVTQQYTSGQSGTIKVYKDGVLVASGTATDGYGTTDNVESLGLTTTADANKSMTVDGVFFKNSVLTPTEMLDLHKRMYY